MLEISKFPNEPKLKDAPSMAGKTLYQQFNNDPLPQMDPILLATLEELRGCPITFTNIHDIPCTEISDDAVRNIEPLVSVHMLAYNHEKFIVQAIEGVVNQETNFPFELVIGEDCSTDRTRDIILEYQRKYPHIIRVLVSKTNLSQNGSSNAIRTTLCCRGKYIAYCEGDDYWIDMKKLQKQIDLIKEHPELSLVHTKSAIYSQNSSLFYKSRKATSKTIIKNINEIKNNKFFNTLTVLFRTDCYKKYLKENPVFFTRFVLGDFKFWLELQRQNINFGYIDQCMTVYRKHNSGVTIANGGNLEIDVNVLLYYYNTIMNLNLDLENIKYKCVLFRCNVALANNSKKDYYSAIDFALKHKIYSKSRCVIAKALMHSGCYRLYFLLTSTIINTLKKIKHSFPLKYYYYTHHLPGTTNEKGQ